MGISYPKLTSYTDNLRRKKCWGILKKYGLNSITGNAGGKTGTPAGKVASPAIKSPAGTGSKKHGQGEVAAEQDDGGETPSKKAKVEAEKEKGVQNSDS